jgi:hypothetical protein
MTQRKVIMFALASIVALVLGIATGRALDTYVNPAKAERAG